MPGVADMASAWLHHQLDGVGEEISDAMVADVKDSIDTECPVYFGKGGIISVNWRGALEERHSPPGWPPFLETGALQEGVGREIHQDTNGVEVVIFSQRNGDDLVPNELEYFMGHPYMAPAYERGKEKIIPEILAARVGG